MPIYTYRCADCGSRFERLLPMSAGPDQPCACGAVAHKVITDVAFHGAGPRPSASDPVPLRRRLPSSLEGVGGGREGVAHFQRVEERLARFEERNPEFKDRKMPVVSHEGGRIVHARAKKPDLTPAVAAATAAAAGDSS
ncbi:zinc ribbon domain-containing protein [Streptomyces sp. NPDC047000]|uniref:FmdB family zinc ribbon protein n=1 Tax=Streptomyces sp. NPDC047000 TaxID=3155474 RepID=UPI0033F6AFD8